MKTIGIIGGLGPLATADFFQKIINKTPAKTDQENIPIIIYNNPQIPDRTRAILDGGKSPVEEIIRTGKILEDMGADFLCIPCNTSFYFYDQVQQGLEKEVLNMIDLTVDHIEKNNFSKVCVLATKGTIKSQIYHKKLREKAINTVETDDTLLEYLEFVIYQVVKKNSFDTDVDFFIDKLEELDKNKDTSFILACTELPIFFEKFKLYDKFQTLDPTLILAKEAVRRALK